MDTATCGSTDGKDKAKSLFVRGAWLYTMPKALSEKEFLERAGGVAALLPFQKFPYVTLVLDADKPLLVGHINGRTISIVMSQHRHKKWQTMEWKRKTA